VDDGLQLAPRRQLRFLEGTLVDTAVGKKAQAEADAAHVERLQPDRFDVLADDELGRAAADIHHQLARLRIGQRMRHAEIDQARFLAPGDHLDREAERGLGLLQELGAFFATRKVLVATARTAPGSKSRRRSPKRDSASMPRCCAAASSFFSGVRPAASAPTP
jgi:hypothetical protein